MIWITPKIDFTENDYYNFTDFNRVENNINYLREYLIELGYKVPLLDIKTDRTNESIDFISSINRIETNIELIKNKFIIPPNYQGSKIWTVGLRFSYLDANRLEKNLDAIYYWASRVPKSYVYCGQFKCGQGGIL